MGLFAAQEDTGQEAVSRTKTIDMRCLWNFLIATSRREWEIQWECRTPLRDRVSCVRVTRGGRRTAQRGPLLLGSFGPHPSVWFPGFLIRRPWAGETSHGASPQPRATEMQSESPGDWLRNQPNKFSFRGSPFARLVSLCTSVIKQCVFFFPYCIWPPGIFLWWGQQLSKDLPQRLQNRSSCISIWTVISLRKESSWSMILLMLHGKFGLWAPQILNSQWNCGRLPFNEKFHSYSPSWRRESTFWVVGVATLNDPADQLFSLWSMFPVNSKGIHELEGEIFPYFTFNTHIDVQGFVGRLHGCEAGTFFFSGSCLTGAMLKDTGNFPLATDTGFVMD